MTEVLLAAIPGFIVSVAMLGFGVFWHFIIAMTCAVALEALVLVIRGHGVAFNLGDRSVILLAMLLALAIPPLAPWWITVSATAFAVLIGKHAYGGLGQNLFNPAMVGYVFVLVCFPRETSYWPVAGIVDPYSGPISSLVAVLGSADVDAVSGATALDYVRTQERLMIMTSEIPNSPVFGMFASSRYEWINLAFLLGGVWLLVRRLIVWRIPVSLLAGLCMTALMFQFFDPDRSMNVGFHLFAGATMLGAFFIATDPVSAATTPRGQLLYGFGIGILIYLARKYGTYPDGVGIAVVCMNATVPLMDRLLRPRILGEGTR